MFFSVVKLMAFLRAHPVSEKQGQVLVFNLVLFVSSTAFPPVNYRTLCHPGKISGHGAFRFH